MILATLAASWQGMQAIHELGHVLGAQITGGQVARVVWHPMTISRTELAVNPHPGMVVWAGPIVGILAPLALWTLASTFQLPGTYLIRFFAGFCCIANGAYIAGGAWDGFGDCGVMCRHGSPIWLLWVFGLVTVPTGLWLWHGQGEYFGMGQAQGRVECGATIAALLIAVFLTVLGWTLGGKD